MKRTKLITGPGEESYCREVFSTVGLLGSPYNFDKNRFLVRIASIDEYKMIFLRLNGNVFTFPLPYTPLPG